MSKFPKPLAQRVILEPIIEKKEESYFSILPESEEKPKTGIVKAVGIGMYATETGILIPMEVKIGDKVLYSPFAGASINIEEKDYLLLKQDDISLIL